MKNALFGHVPNSFEDLPQNDGSVVFVQRRFGLFFLLRYVLLQRSAFYIFEHQVQNFVLFKDSMEFGDVFMIEKPQKFDLVLKGGFIFGVFDAVLDDLFGGVDLACTELFGQVHFRKIALTDLLDHLKTFGETFAFALHDERPFPLQVSRPFVFVKKQLYFLGFGILRFHIPLHLLL